MRRAVKLLAICMPMHLILLHTSECFDFFSSRQFVEACGHGLGINERLIKEDQQEYHDEMKASYRDLAKELSIIMHEQVSAVSLKLAVLMLQH